MPYSDKVLSIVNNLIYGIDPFDLTTNGCLFSDIVNRTFHIVGATRSLVSFKILRVTRMEPRDVILMSDRQLLKKIVVVVKENRDEMGHVMAPIKKIKNSKGEETSLIALKNSYGRRANPCYIDVFNNLTICEGQDWNIEDVKIYYLTFRFYQ